MARLRHPDIRKLAPGRKSPSVSEESSPSGMPGSWPTSTPRSNRHLVGKNIVEIADEREIEPAEVVIELMEEEGGSVPTLVHNRVESDVRYFMGHDLAMIGSDGNAVSPNGPYRDALPHPRFYGTHPAHSRPLRPRAARRPDPGAGHPQDDRLPGPTYEHEETAAW